MLELMFCALFTILPDYLIKRYVFKKRWGAEINFYTMWYELRWGISACAILTVTLITLIFYYHPSTTNATSAFRTITILTESRGRVDQVFVKNNQNVKKGAPIFSVESSSQKAAVETAKSQVEEINSEIYMVKQELKEKEGELISSQSKLTQARDDYKRMLFLSNGVGELVSKRDVELSKSKVNALEGSVNAARARLNEVEANLNVVLPARLETAQNELEEAKVELEKTVVYADVSGTVTQFVLQPGDVVSPFLRPAGLLVPDSSELSGTQAVQAGFSQLAAPIVKPGTYAEVTCLSQPFTIIPMVVTNVQTNVAAGQIRPTDHIVDLQERAQPGTLTTRLEPLYENSFDNVLPGSKCIANAYTNNHDLLESGELTTSEFLFYHMVDAVGVVHAILLRIQTLLIPVQNLVFAGH